MNLFLDKKAQLTCVCALFHVVNLAAQQVPVPDPNDAKNALPKPPHDFPREATRRIASMPMRSPALQPPPVFQKFQKKTVSMRIASRILTPNNEEIWKNEYNRVTMPGHPVTLRLVGDNIAVIVQFTPYPRNPNQWVLVAQGQMWFENTDKTLRYETTLQTIPVKLGEPVYYFPLGSNNAKEDYIEICLELTPFVPPPKEPHEPKETNQE